MLTKKGCLFVCLFVFFFSKFQLIPTLHLQVTSMHDYVCWHCSIDYCVKWSLVDKTFMHINGSHFIRKWFLPNSFGECASCRRAINKMQKVQILNFLRAPSIWILGVCMSLCKKLLSFHKDTTRGNDFSLIPLVKYATKGRATNRCNKFKLWKILRAPSIWNL